MKKMMLGLGLMLLSAMSFSSQAELNKTLVRVINQINATLPLLDEAQDEIEPNSRTSIAHSCF